MKSRVHRIGWPPCVALIAVTACGGISDPGAEDDDTSGRPADAAADTGSSKTADASTDTGSFSGDGGTGGREAGPDPAAGGLSATGGTGGAPIVTCEGVPCLLQSAATCCIRSVCGLTDPATGDCSDPLAGFRDAGVESEPIVNDPVCGDITYLFIGAPFTLPGCCDVSGMCGGNTGELPTLSGLPFPALCITPAEGAPLLVSTSAPVPCGADSGRMTTDGGPDASSSEDAQPTDASSRDAIVPADVGASDASADTD